MSAYLWMWLTLGVALYSAPSSLRDSLQEKWDWFRDDFAGGDEMLLWTVFWLITFVFYWTFNIGFMWLELTGRPAALLKYRVQLDNKPAPVKPELFFKCVRGVLYNQVTVGLPFHYAFYGAVRWRGGLLDKELPSMQRMLRDIGIAALGLELLFYYSHRLLHRPFFYQRYHKVHHEWKAPISISAIYCHPFEYFLSNLLPLVVGPLFSGAHYTSMLLWVLVSSGSGCIAHSGYHMPFMPSNETHDFHHSQFNQVFGMLGILDTVHGTNSRFKASVSYARHFMLLGTTPANILIPDKK